MGAIIIPSSRRDTAIRAEKGWEPKAPEGFMTSGDAARVLGISDNQLRAMRSNTRGMDAGPAFYKMPDGHHVIYRPQDVRSYLEKKACQIEAKAVERAAKLRAQATITGPFGGNDPAPAVADDDEAARLTAEANSLR